MNQGQKLYAPETAVGTGAQTPLVDPAAAAALVPSIDQSTVSGGGAGGNNKPRANESATIQPSGNTLAEPKDTRTSTGEDEETRTNPVAHARDSQANAVASTVRPTVPQDNRSNARPAGTPTSSNLPGKDQLLSLPADATAPTAPTGLASPAKTATTVDLKWNVVGDAHSYRVRRGGVDVAGATALTEPKFKDTGRTTATAYSYTVSAADDAGNRSPESSALSVTTS